MRLLSSLLILSLLVPLVAAQGSAAGVGGGGGMAGGFGGGGMGGGRFGDASDEQRQVHPEDDPRDDYGARLYSTRTAILPPGDRVEYKLKVAKGETLFAGATSEAFDPALAVEDAAGKTLAKNDDREEGDQAPFISYRFAEAGTYTLKVLSYKQAAGGKFTLKLRTFVASDAPLGRSVHEFSGNPTERRLDVRIQAKKGAVYDLRAFDASDSGYVAPHLIRIVGPTGVEREDFDRVVVPDDSAVFQAKRDGDYYAEYQGYGLTRFVTTVAEVPVTRTAPDGEAAIDLSPGGLSLIEFPVTAKLLVRTTLIGAGFFYSTTAPSTVSPSETPEYRTVDPGFGNTPSWTFLLLDRFSDRDVVRIYRAEGNARIAIRSFSKEKERIALRNSTQLPAWKAGETISDKLDVGQVRLYRLESVTSELMRVSAESPTFRPRLDIFRLDGSLANTLPYQTKRLAADDLYFPKADTFLVRLSCEGYGGSGEFRLRRDTPKPVAYTLGTTQSLTFDGTNFGLYAVTLEAGKRYQLRTEGNVAGLRTDILDADGVFVRSQTVSFDAVQAEYFVPPHTGTYRLWLRGTKGTLRFRLEPYATPTLGAP